MATYEIGFKPASLGTSTLGATGSMYALNKNDFSSSGSSISPIHLVTAGQKITGMYIGGRASTNGVSASVFGGAYVTDSTGTTDGAKVFGGSLIAATTSNTVQWHYSALDIDLSAFVGQYIKPVPRDDGSQFRISSLTGASGDFKRKAADFPDPFGSGAIIISSLIPSYLVIEDVAANSIDSVNDDYEINSAAVNTAEVAGYDDGVNPIVSGTVGSLALTSVSQTGTTVSFTPPAPVNAAYWPEPDVTQTLTLTDGTTPSTFDAVFRPPPGYSSVVLVSPDNSDPYKLGYWATTTPVDDDRIIAEFTVNPDTSFSGATAGTYTWYHWVNATSTIYAYEATIGAGSETRGVLMARPLTAKSVTAKALGAVALSSAVSALFYGTSLTEFTNMAVFNV